MSEQYTYRSKTEQSSELWTTHGFLNVKNQAVDLQIHTTRLAFLYETHCFDTISAQLQADEFAVGPHMVDYLLMKDGWESQIRPDGLIFTAQPDMWILTTLIEIKTGKYAMHRKLKGFSHLLERFRMMPRFLPSILEETIGDIYETPKEILIPENQHIHVIFAGPSEKKLDPNGHGQLFNLKNMKIDFQ